MRLDEIVSLSDVLKTPHFNQLVGSLNSRVGHDINITRIKNRIIQAWRRGHRSKKHFAKLLKPLGISLNDLIK